MTNYKNNATVNMGRLLQAVQNIWPGYDVFTNDHICENSKSDN